MNFFIAIDTYSHAPRNFFGFKKKNRKSEERIAAIAIFSESGGSYVAQFEEAKIKDDPSWNGKLINPADYGYGKSTYRIIREAADFMDLLMNSDEDHEMFTDKNIDNVSDYVYNIMYDIQRSTQNVSEEYVPFTKYEASIVNLLSDETFTGSLDSYALYINKRPGEKYTPEQKMELYRSHIRFPRIVAADLSRERAHKMLEQYNLLGRICKVNSEE